MSSGGMWLDSFLTIWYSSVRLWIKQSAEEDSEMWLKAQEELSKQDLCCKFHFWPLKWKSCLQLLSYSQAVTTAGCSACLICCGFYTARQPQRCRSRVLSRDLRNFKLNVCIPSITISRRRPWDVLYCNIFKQLGVKLEPVVSIDQYMDTVNTWKFFLCSHINLIIFATNIMFDMKIYIYFLRKYHYLSSKPLWLLHFLDDIRMTNPCGEEQSFTLWRAPHTHTRTLTWFTRNF